MMRRTLLEVARRQAKRSAKSATAIRTSATMIKSRIPKAGLTPEFQQVIQDMPDIPFYQEEPASVRQYVNPVTSAHMIEGQEISTLDSVALSPSDGKVIHGRYGELPEPAASAIPLEYLALLRPAAEGAAALRALSESGKKGTIVVYGASSANGMSLAQLANAAGHTVVGVVDGNHSGNDDILFSLKHMMDEPGTVVPEEFAINKSIFRELVSCISSGDEGYAPLDPETYLSEFKDLFQQYSEFYPDTRPAAVSEETLEFKDEYLERDRSQWEANMGTYLEANYPPGAPPVDMAKLEATFTSQQLQIFRQRFWKTYYMMVSGVDVGDDFSAAHMVHDQIQAPHDPQESALYASGMPYIFNMHNPEFPANTDVSQGGPVLGAVICVTPELVAATKAVAEAGSSLRAQAEALQFLPFHTRHAFLAARSVAQQAQSRGAPVIVIGGELPGAGLTMVEPTKDDVQTALQGLDIDDEGKTVINFFVQSYRACDFPFYADFAVHRANEVMAGPRQFIVLK